MSNLYKEALIDGRKLREIAEEEAKKKLLEKFTPYVKEMITKEFQTVSLFAENAEAAFVVGEQEEDPAQADPNAALPPPQDPTNISAAPADPAAAVPPVPPADATPPMTTQPPAVAAEPALSNPPTATELPVEPIGGGNELGNTSLDAISDDGKIVVDVNDLFSPEASEAIAQADMESTAIDAAPPAPLPPSPEEELPGDNAGTEEPIATDAELQSQPTEELPQTPEQLVERVTNIVNSINELSSKIDLLCLSENKVKEIEKNYQKTRLFSLLEQVDTLKENGLITGKQATILENKLEILFIKLKEANFTNSYKRINVHNTGDNTNMAKSLKSIAAKLFLEEADPIEKTQSAADARSKAASAHAKSASGNPKNVKAESEDSVPTKEKEVAWDEQDPNGQGVLEENAEVGDETVSASAGFGDTSEEPEVEFEVSEAELMEAIRQIRKEQRDRKYQALKESLEECGDEDMMEEQAEFGEEDAEVGVDVAGGDVDVEAAEADLQAAFEALGISDVSVDLNSGADDEEIEIVDDEEGADLGSEETDMVLHDDEEEELAAEMALYEAAKKKIAAKRLQEAAVKTKQLKKELHENNVFTAKTIFLNKILMREGKDLSKDTMKKVVELLDKARTLSEAKEIYQKILVRLQESKQVANKKVSGQSKQASTTPATLKEGKTPTKQPEVLQEGVISLARWQQIAGIK